MPQQPKLSLLPIKGWSSSTSANTEDGDPWDAPAANYRKAPTPENADSYLSSVRPIIDEAVKVYAGGVTAPPIIARAKSIALNAGLKHDPAQSKLKTYLLTQLQGLRRYSARVNAPARIPEQTAIDTQRLDRHAADLRIELGREPSDAELADKSGIPIERVVRARGLPTTFALSTAPEGLQLIQPTRAAKDRQAWVEFVYHDLAPTDKVILERSTGLNGHKVLTTGEIARMLGITAGAVSQRKAKIDKLLNEHHLAFPDSGDQQ